MYFSLYTKRLVTELRDIVAQTENLECEPYNCMLNAISQIATYLSKNEELLTQNYKPQLANVILQKNLLKCDVVIGKDPFYPKGRALIRDPLEYSD